MSTMSAPSARAEDDFVVRRQIDRPASAETLPERRMHLRAFDYWQGLNVGHKLPQFEHLTAEGLTPFRQNCLLLEHHSGEMLVRFCGAELAALLSKALAPGTRLIDAPPTSFSKAMQQRFSTELGRQDAAEFEFIDPPLECRGAFLPFSARGDHAEFIMVVVNHRPMPLGDEAAGNRSKTAKVKEGDVDALATLADGCAEAGQTVIHPGAGTREGLYSALAQAYRLHIAAVKNQSAYTVFLRRQGLRQQRRAPFTPALKLTFGKDYDKTRLTEYAAALSCAARNEVGPSGLSDFLKNYPGGIKGCVQHERAVRQGKATGVGKSDAKKRSIGEARVSLRKAPPIGLDAVKLDQEFGLVLVRRSDDGRTELISTSNSPQHVIDKAIIEIASKDEN